MSTVLYDPVTGPTDSPAQRLRTTMAAVRVSLQWLGVRKTLTAEQKNQAADTFGATGDYLSIGKKLLDTRHPSMRWPCFCHSLIISTIWVFGPPSLSNSMAETYNILIADLSARSSNPEIHKFEGFGKI